MNKSDRNVSTYYLVVQLYSINVSSEIFVADDHYHHLHAKLFNKFLIIFSHQYLLRTPNHLC